MKDLEVGNYFTTPIYKSEIPEWVKQTNEVCEPFVKDAKERNKEPIKNRNKFLKKNIGDHGYSHHSISLINIHELSDLKNYILKSSHEVLDHMGYNLTNYKIAFTEFWVQEFSKKGGGYHEAHIHYDNHISGFYFLKCSNKTSNPFFVDPRVGKLCSQLPEKNSNEITSGSSLINVSPQPGTFIMFPSFIQHGFTVDSGVEPFRFIHFNLQAVRTMVIN
jgi:uncharacterized protein (TIGR02466 family)